MLARIILLAALAGAVGACASETRVVVAANDPCTAYGFTPGTTAYAQCQSRELAARQQGRVIAGYPDARIMSDSQAACRSYGLVPYSAGYDQCVQREFQARRPV
jgi:hypothetical protein